MAHLFRFLNNAHSASDNNITFFFYDITLIYRVHGTIFMLFVSTVSTLQVHIIVLLLGDNVLEDFALTANLQFTIRSCVKIE